MNDCRTTEFYEAFYIFEQMRVPTEPLDKTLTKLQAQTTSSIRQALEKILVSTGYLDFESPQLSYGKQAKAIENATVSSKTYLDQKPHLQGFYENAINPNHNFFTQLTPLEYEIYALHNFEVTQRVGKLAADWLDLTNERVLEVGGNSGGFATAITQNRLPKAYTIIDSAIPCRIGRAHQKSQVLNLKFIEGDVFDLSLPKQQFDCFICMNFLHDYDDQGVMAILKQLLLYGHKGSKIVIIEDLLTAYIEPHEVIMQGLRLAVACKGATQRTVADMSKLLEGIGYKLTRQQILNPFQTLLIYHLKDIIEGEMT